jgi:hypothetical protein
VSLQSTPAAPADDQQTASVLMEAPAGGQENQPNSAEIPAPEKKASHKRKTTARRTSMPLLLLIPMVIVERSFHSFNFNRIFQGLSVLQQTVPPRWLGL